MDVKQLNKNFKNLLQENEYNDRDYWDTLYKVVYPIKSKCGLHFYTTKGTYGYNELYDAKDRQIRGVYFLADVFEPKIELAFYYGKNYFFQDSISDYLNVESYGFKKTDASHFSMPLDTNNFKKQITNLVPFIKKLLQTIEIMLQEKRNFYLRYLRDISDYDLGDYTLSVNNKKYTTMSYKDFSNVRNISLYLNEKVKWGFCPTFMDKISNLYNLRTKDIGNYIFPTEKEANKGIEIYYNYKVKRRESVSIPKIEIIPVYLDGSTVKRIFQEKNGTTLSMYKQENDSVYLATTENKLLEKILGFGSTRYSYICSSAKYFSNKFI